MSYLEELLPEFRKGAKIRCTDWEPHCFVYCKNGMIYDQNEQVMPRLTFSHVVSDSWEFYKEPEPYWDYIIENKCPCWFRDFTWDNYKISFLAETYIDGGETRRFLDAEDKEWLRCIPIRKDEMIFYEDRENT